MRAKNATRWLVLFSGYVAFLGLLATSASAFDIRLGKSEKTDPAVLVQDAYGAYQKGDFDSAFDQWQEAANNNDAHAQYNLGHLYAEGRGVARNPHLAVKWWLAAAEQGHIPAQHNLGLALLGAESIVPGHANKPNIEGAVKWLSEAASAGSPHAQNALGILYKSGFGIEKNLDQAVTYFNSAAKQGLDTAQANLADCYEKGTGVTADIEQAAKWLELAALGGNAPAQHKLAMLYDVGEGVERDPVEAYIWARRAEENGFISADKTVDKIKSELSSDELASAEVRVSTELN